MKKLMSLVALGSALALSACGGSSESSSFTGTKTLGNGNQYTCTSEAAMDSCTSDSTCSASCSLTHKAVAPVDTSTPTGGKCKVDGNNIIGKKGKTCIVNLPALNKGKDVEMSCKNGKLILGGSSFSPGMTINGSTFKCS